MPCPWAPGGRITTTAALPFLRYMDIAYRAYAVQPFRFPGLMWDDTIVFLERDDTHPIHGTLLDQRTYDKGILRVDVPGRKIHHGSTSDPQPLRSPTPEAMAQHVGRHVVCSTVFRWEDRCTKTVIVGMLSMRCAEIRHC